MDATRANLILQMSFIGGVLLLFIAYWANRAWLAHVESREIDSGLDDTASKYNDALVDAHEELEKIVFDLQMRVRHLELERGDAADYAQLASRLDAVESWQARMAEGESVSPEHPANGVESPGPTPAGLPYATFPSPSRLIDRHAGAIYELVFAYNDLPICDRGSLADWFGMTQDQYAIWMHGHGLPEGYVPPDRSASSSRTRIEPPPDLETAERHRPEPPSPESMARMEADLLRDAHIAVWGSDDTDMPPAKWFGLDVVADPTVSRRDVEFGPMGPSTMIPIPMTVEVLGRSVKPEATDGP